MQTLLSLFIIYLLKDANLQVSCGSSPLSFTGSHMTANESPPPGYISEDNDYLAPMDESHATGGGKIYFNTISI